ncbi:hypothetical protein ISF_10006 [Cordyceps fumosorosea ARSEF 2679]|uniref:Uncharacterized protein n=1 Tax=Cordyceps fumosorosea (strain ARSEF 2679) TaxID=1081104 RepID=A0A166WCZ0_CORFA|nr:hypothetical protein ISF_10006 [Cordyceps fumosorosea ARSEF 2679]OAA34593.1 hypothetical protein ISF_10006 [Cordyceps fumosorosea ARSEF 2679]
MPKPSVVLYLLSLGALLAPVLHSVQSGMSGLILDNVHSAHPVLPGTDIPLRTSWTGLALLDVNFSVMICVFYVILDPHNLSLFIQGGHFFGLWMAAWILVLLESVPSIKGSTNTRPPRRSRKYVIWGLIMEFMTVAFGLPAWCASNLQQSPIEPRAASSPCSASSLDIAEIKMLPWSFVLSTGIPTFLMLICRPDAEAALFSQQTWILLRLFHPLLFATAHGLLITKSQRSREQNCSRQEDPGTEQARELNKLYTVAFWIAAIPHLLVISGVLFAKFFPRLLPAPIVASLSVGALWPVASIWRSVFVKVESTQQGVALFMTANEIISTVALLVWAWNRGGAAIPKSGRNGQQSLRIGFWKAIFLASIFGPGAAAVAYVQHRNAVLQQMTLSDNKKR